VRQTIPSNGLYWSVYARGTFQNMSVFGSHYSWLEPGCFLFKLTTSAFDTTRLRDGVYNLVVTQPTSAATTARSRAGSRSTTRMVKADHPSPRPDARGGHRHRPVGSVQAQVADDRLEKN
jgi:hypothetical protein